MKVRGLYYWLIAVLLFLASIGFWFRFGNTSSRIAEARTRAVRAGFAQTSDVTQATVTDSYCEPFGRINVIVEVRTKTTTSVHHYSVMGDKIWEW